MRNDFAAAITGKAPTRTVIAYFRNHEPVVYPMGIFELLKTDREVTGICDGQTGEIIYEGRN